MRKLITNITMMIVLMFFTAGCGENGSLNGVESETQGGTKISVSFQNRGNKAVTFQKSTTITRVHLVVTDNSTGKKHFEGDMQNTTGIFEVSLSLKQGVSYTFKAEASTGISPNYTVLYQGTTTVIPTAGQDIKLVLKLVGDSDRGTMHDVKIDSTDKGTYVVFDFTITNSKKNNLEYNLTTTGSGIFTPKDGILNFPSTSEKHLDVNYTKPTTMSDQNCSIVLTDTVTGDIRITLFTISASGNVQVNMPPNIQGIQVTDNGSKFTVLADADDPEGDTPFSYLWSITAGGTTTIVGTTGVENPLQLENYSSGILCIDLNVTDNRGASTKINECIKGSPSSTLKKTGQTKSYDVNGVEVPDDSLKDDGYYKKGVTPHYERNATTEIVTDHITGLKWEDDVNVGDDAMPWETIQNYCQSKTLDNGGWRPPTIEELATIIDINRTDLTPVIFSNQIPNNNLYWSSTDSFSSNNVWALSPIKEIGLIEKESTQNIRCVKGSTPTLTDFTRDNSNNIVTDNTNGLQWEDNDSIASLNWEAAISYCETLNLDGTGWRLPNFKELNSIVDRNSYTPPYIHSKFNHTSDDYYWSSTTIINFDAWVILFELGMSNSQNKPNTGSVRCVRDKP